MLISSNGYGWTLTLCIRTDNPIPRPPPGHELKCDTSKPYHSDDTCYPAEYGANQQWSLAQIFGRPMKGTCPLSDPKIPPVCLHVPDSRGVYTSGGVETITSKDGLSRCFKVQPEAEFDLVLSHVETEGMAPPALAGSIIKPETPSLYAERSFTGYGQERGGVQTILRNPSPDKEVEFVYMESLPWFLRIYLHTLSTQITTSPSSSSKVTTSSNFSTPNTADIIKEIYYRPALDRTRGTQLELLLRIPPRATVFLTYDFEKSVLRYTEYPPDANRGFDVAAAVITTLSPRVMSIRTTSLLLYLPVPDFSMPYNVIIFTSTAKPGSQSVIRLHVNHGGSKGAGLQRHVLITKPSY